MISAKFVPLKYYTLSSQLQRLTSFSVGCSGRRILSPGQIAVMRKWSIAVLPWRYAPMGPSSIHSPGAVRAFGFQSILAFPCFLRFFLLHLKPDFLNKSVSNHFMEAFLKLNAFALLGFTWFSAKS